MANNTGSVTKSICFLPEWYVEVPLNVLRRENSQPPDMGRPKVPVVFNDKYEWLHQMKISVSQE